MGKHCPGGSVTQGVALCLQRPRCIHPGEWTFGHFFWPLLFASPWTKRTLIIIIIIKPSSCLTGSRKRWHFSEQPIAPGQRMYWELWLSQVTASAALVPCMLIRDKGGQAVSSLRWGIVLQESKHFIDVILNIPCSDEPSALSFTCKNHY